MIKVKLTKNELRQQQVKLNQLERYLPTLKLKKALLQVEVNNAHVEVEKLQQEFESLHHVVDSYSSLLSEYTSVNLEEINHVNSVIKSYENIAGVEIPQYEGVVFEDVEYNLFETPPWVDSAVADMRIMIEGKVKVYVGQEKIEALEKELREVSIRVNLFEKILIPRATHNIRKIKVFLGDQELAAVGQAKVAKAKIELLRMHTHES